MTYVPNEPPMGSLFMEYFQQYFILVYFSTLGVLQIASVYAGLKGLLFFRKPLLVYIFAAVAIIGAFTWFYLIADRTAEPLMSIHNGKKRFFGEAESFGGFMAAAFSALVSTILISSLLNARIATSPQEKVPEGLDALKEMTFFQAINRRIRKGK